MRQGEHQVAQKLTSVSPSLRKSLLNVLSVEWHIMEFIFLPGFYYYFRLIIRIDNIVFLYFFFFFGKKS